MNTVRNLYFKFLKQIKRAKLKNYNFSIISNNCCGGIIYNSLGERFNSPTINLAVTDPNEYLTFLKNLKECFESQIIDISDPNKQNYPIGRIELSSGEKIDIHFMHYKTFAEAINKWDERKTRVDFDNLFVFMEAGVLTTNEIVAEFDALEFKNKVIITNRAYPEYKSSYFIDIYDSNYVWGKLISYVPKTLKTRRYIDSFDYIKWLNNGR